MNTQSAAVAKLNLSELLENSRIGPLQIRVFVLCMACLIMDGFDVQAMGYVAPAVLRDWGLPGSRLGPVFAAANFGVLIGALGFSMLADKIGRRPVLVWSTLFFSVMTLATAYAQNIEQLLWLRFISGIGMGCIIPNATALVGEFSPKQSRVTLMMCITVGFTAGAAIGGFVAAWLIPAFGWRSVFIFGGAVPLVIAIAMLWGLPESLQFLAVRKTRLDQLARWLKQLDPTIRIDAATQYVANETSRSGVPILHLFREGRAPFTILLWMVNFTNILVLYSLSNWLPTIVTSMGYDTQTAVLVGTLLQVGGTIGTFGLAWLIARKGFTPMLAVTFAVATVSIAFIGQPGITLTLLCVIVFIAGWCIVGGQPGVNAMSATFYPTYMRSTGVGAGLGVGRIGAIVGPYVGGVLLAHQWAPQQLFWAAAIPAFISTLIMLALRFVLKGGKGGMT
ncbi:MAG TPA: aromatic acid/H+ symport family MFS transporter [Gammaproteobacteria bacterium]|nr:aromatic acid/H+ symport family MFS transporter [Gammaproteobacteria bacterium]